MTERLDWSAAAIAAEVGPASRYDEKHIQNCVEMASTAGDGCARYVLARRHLCGIDAPINRKKASFQFLESAELGCGCAAREASSQGLFPSSIEKDISEKLDPDEQCATLLEQIVQSIFGLGRQSSAVDAHKAILKFRKMHHCGHRDAAEALYSVVPANSDFAMRLANYFRQRPLQANHATDNNLDEIWHLFRLRHAKQICITFLSMSLIACSRGWVNYASWRRRAILSELYILDIDYGSFKNSHNAIGLPQNVRTSNGVFYPNRYVAPKDNSRMWMTHLDGIHYETKGKSITEIAPMGRQESNFAALITGEDFATALCLAFASSEKNPSVSLELPPKRVSDSRLSSLLYKEFKPFWLAATEFGGSMYCADLMAGRFDSYYGIVSFDDPLILEKSDDANLVRGYFTRYSSNHAVIGSDRTRICLSLYSVNSIHHKHSVSGFLIRTEKHALMFDRIGFRIDGSGIKYFGTHRTTVYENNPSKPEAHQGLSLTNRLPKLEKAFPVFRRVKYLLALTRSLIELRRSGLRLSAPLQAEVLSWKEKLIRDTSKLCLHIAPP